MTPWHRLGFLFPTLLLLAMACAPATPAASPTAPARAATATWPEQQQFEQTVVPAALREAKLNWYTCTPADEAEARIRAFNEVYPAIKVNYVYALTGEGVQKITAESKSGRMTADMWNCGGQSGRTVVNNGAASTEGWTPPAIKEPGVQWNWDVLDSVGNFGVSHVNLGGLYINTNLVPKEQYPTEWKDLLTNQWWVDNIKAGKIVLDDPRVPGAANYYVHAFKDLYTAEYGEFFPTLASWRVKLQQGYAGQVLRGEYAAKIFQNPSQVRAEIEEKGPVAMLCPKPGCNLTLYSWVLTKDSPNANAAKVFTNFWFTKEGQTVLTKYMYSPGRKDVSMPDQYAFVDFTKQPYTFWPDVKQEEGNRAALDWVISNRIFDY
jgi:iron(III) transport system substrate-binding protein